tara:strand:+ start:802 stop:2769 length:1968 start_codon:yes stop_codon:yes gene_type:complete
MGASHATIGGGICNSMNNFNADCSFIGGGCCNTVKISFGNIVGGSCNTIGSDGTLSIIGAGTQNTASGTLAFIGSGDRNSITGGGGYYSGNSVIVGGSLNCIYQAYNAGVFTGRNNEISQYQNKYSIILGGQDHTISGAYGYSVIVGGKNNCVEGVVAGFIGSGCNNKICNNAIGYGRQAVIVGGVSNKTDQDNSFIGGGVCNSIVGYYNSYSVIVGGHCNFVGGPGIFIGSGKKNTANGYYSSVVGGRINTASATYSSVVGGQQNSVKLGRNSFIGGGIFNTGSASYSSIVGGKQNYTSGGGTNQKHKFIGGGTLNKVGVNNGGDNAQGYNSSIVGGFTNRVYQASAFIGGGKNNTVYSYYGDNGVIVGGDSNIIGAYTNNAAIVGGKLNKVTANNGFIGGGCCNVIANSCSTIGGGCCNSVYGMFDFIGGGRKNCSSGYYSSNVIAGGYYNTISYGSSCTHGFIGSGFKNCIDGYSNDSAILGGRHNLINNSQDDVFLVGSFLTASATGAVCELITYMNNTVVTGSLTVGSKDAINATVGRIDATNDIVAFSTSDERLKCNIRPIDNALCKVIGVTGNTFDWKELTKEETQTIHGNTGRDVGVIAQEIEKILPEAVTTRDSGYKAVNYEKIIPLLIEAIKEQQKQIDELKSRL